MVFALKHAPPKEHVAPYPSPPLPATLYGADRDACLFMKDPASDTRTFITEQGMETLASKVFSVSELKAECSTYESRRRLMHQFDLFLADKRILPTLPRIIGKTFFVQHRYPIPVHITTNDRLRAGLEDARSRSYLFLSPGTCSSAKIGRPDFTPSQLAANLSIAIPEWVDKLPGRWQGVQAIYLKSNRSVSLPLYTSAPSFLSNGAPQQEPRPGSTSSQHSASSSSSAGRNQSQTVNTKQRFRSGKEKGKEVPRKGGSVPSITTRPLPTSTSSSSAAAPSSQQQRKRPAPEVVSEKGSDRSIANQNPTKKPRPKKKDH